MEIIYQPHINRELQSLQARIHPPMVCIDNDSYRDCTVIKVDSSNKRGILLEMVQVLTDLNLVISKSYVSSDGVWFMEVFHVTDQFGNKLTDKNLLLYIQQAFSECSRREETSREIQCKVPQKYKTVLEMTGGDRPGLLSEISAVLLDLGCNVTAVKAWTHNDRAACIMYVEDQDKCGPIKDPIRLAQVEEQLENVVEAHHGKGERRSVRLTTFAAGGTHTERRLHQLMYADGDYERCEGESSDGTQVWVGSCEDKGYWVVNVRSRDRPKLLFDTVCVLTDMEYVVYHAAIRSKGSMTEQEYFVRHGTGDSTLDAEFERKKLTLCIVAAIERRVSHASPIPTMKVQGLRVDLHAKNRKGLLSDVTRVFRENGLSISRAEIATEGEKAVGSFYVRDYSGEEVNPNIVDLVREETGGSIVAVHKSPFRLTRSQSSSSPRTLRGSQSSLDSPRSSSFGRMLWSRLERLSINFRPIRS